MNQGHTHSATNLDPLLPSADSALVPPLRYSFSRLLEHLGIVIVSLAFAGLIFGASFLSPYWGAGLLAIGTLFLFLGFWRARIEERELLEADRARLLSAIRLSLAEWAQEIASEGEGLPESMTASLEELSSLPDPALCKVARDHFPAKAASRLETLNLKDQRQGLIPMEEEEREGLLAGYERVMLLRAEAARLLDERGHDVSALRGE